MKDIVNFIKESSSEFNYAIQYAANERDILSFKYQTSLQRAQNFVQKMKKQGMLISSVYEIPKDKIEEFKKISKRNKRNKLDDIEKCINKEYRKDEIEKFLELK